jgi:hypothetical protein
VEQVTFVRRIRCHEITRNPDQAGARCLILEASVLHEPWSEGTIESHPANGARQVTSPMNDLSTRHYSCTYAGADCEEYRVVSTTRRTTPRLAEDARRAIARNRDLVTGLEC